VPKGSERLETGSRRQKYRSPPRSYTHTRQDLARLAGKSSRKWAPRRAVHSGNAQRKTVRHVGNLKERLSEDQACAHSASARPGFKRISKVSARRSDQNHQAITKTENRPSDLTKPKAITDEKKMELILRNLRRKTRTFVLRHLKAKKSGLGEN